MKKDYLIMAYEFFGGLWFFLLSFKYDPIIPKNIMFWFGGSFMFLLIGGYGLLKNSDIIRINELKKRLDEQMGEKK